MLYERLFLKKTSASGRGNPPLSPIDALHLNRPVDQAQFYDLALPLKGLPTPALKLTTENIL